MKKRIKSSNQVFPLVGQGIAGKEQGLTVNKQAFEMPVPMVKLLVLSLKMPVPIAKLLGQACILPG
jgi:hypothetical protein